MPTKKKTAKKPAKKNPTDTNLLARSVIEALIGEPLTHHLGKPTKVTRRQPNRKNK